ncbi:MAG TPA: TIGR03960 family B12-binding radical SAM protein [Firmicutes bacterium]|nr:TIGR03960 family B12-binding radical SAM protein [Bacillota bacterium]
MILTDQIEALLPHVSTPGRYTGGELNSVVKRPEDVSVRFALAFPDVYEVGMSHLGSHILYKVLNDIPDVACERVYAPWVDMETLMRQNGVPLFSLETRTPVREFDILGFSLEYELSYTNVLNMLQLAGIPLRSSERGESDLLVVAGGPCVFNPEPMAPFIDAFVIGEAEEAVVELVRVYREWKGHRRELLERLAGITGVYVPSFYDACYDGERYLGLKRIDSAVPPKIRKRVLRRLEGAPYPVRPIVPFINIVHDRAVLELFRGCTRGCRFCQAGTIYRPVRERELESLAQMARELISNTGYNEISLASLSSADYPRIQELMERLSDELIGTGVGLSLPSLRVDTFSVELAKEVEKVRKSTFTFAPEAGTDRLRRVINKGITHDQILEACRAAFEAGWDGLKLYFMIGLPTETDQDIEGIAELAREVKKEYGRSGTSRRSLKLHVSVSNFVPKPHTPFQWEAQDSMEELQRKQKFLAKWLRPLGVKLSTHDVRTSFLEAVFARGDRRLAQVLEKAWQYGAHFDAWREQLNFDAWRRAFEHTGIEPRFYATRARDENEVLPWDHIDAGVTKAFLWKERLKALAAETTPDCRFGPCQFCGVCSSEVYSG